MGIIFFVAHLNLAHRSGDCRLIPEHLRSFEWVSWDFTCGPILGICLLRICPPSVDSNVAGEHGCTGEHGTQGAWGELMKQQ